MTLDRHQRIRAIAARSGATISARAAPIPPRPSGTNAASYGQRALWFAHQAAPSSAYNVIAGFRVRGAFDVTRLQEAVRALAVAHAALRTYFAEADGAVVERHDLNSGPTVIVDHVPNLSETARVDQIRALITAEESFVFDVTRAPLARLSVAVFALDDHVVVVNLHHIISDAQSLDILAGELLAAYVSGVPLPPVPIEYADFGAWQTNLVLSDTGRTQIAYWRERLAGAPPVHGLPIETNRSAARARGDRIAVPLDEPSDRAVHQLCRRFRATPASVMFAAYAALVGRFSDEADVVLGFANAYRDKPELQRLIGYLISSLPARFNLAAAGDFAALIAQTADVVSDALAHQDVPLEKLVDELALPREPGIHPIFQIFFSYAGERPSQPSLAGARFEPLPADLLDVRAPKFELLLVVQESVAGRVCVWEWDADLLSRDLIAAMVQALPELLVACARDPFQPLARLSLGPYLHPALTGPSIEVMEESFFIRFARHVARTPYAPAVSDGTSAIDYRTLHDRAERLSAVFAEYGIGVGSRVSVQMRRSIGAVASALACHRLGAAFVPMDGSVAPDRLELMLRAAKIDLVVVESGRASLPVSPGPEIVAIPADGIVDAPLVPPAAADCADHVAYIVFTSGSTGTPKGVMLSHANLCHFLDGMKARFGFASGQRFSIAIDFTTDIGLQNLFCGLDAGGTLVLLDEGAAKDPGLYAAYPDVASVDVGVFTPSHYLALYQPDVFRTPLPRRVLLLEGEALTRAALAPAHPSGGCTLVNGYGPTEATMLCATYSCDRLPAGERIPIGSALPNVRLRVVNAAGVDQPAGAIGELWIEGPTVGLGYCGGAQGKSLGFEVEAGLRRYRTGDRVRLAGAAGLEFLGRRDGQVKIRGFRVEIAEIEATMLDQPGIAACAVRFFPGATGGDGHLAAYMVPAATRGAPDAGELRRALERRLPPHMVPERFLPLDALPSLSNGKIKYSALPEPDWADAQGAGVEPPATVTERVLADIWARILKVASVDRHANFFACGGNSIRCIEVVVAARREGLALSTTQLVRTPRLSELAAMLDQAGQAEQGPEDSDQDSVRPAPFALIDDRLRRSLSVDIVDAFPLSAQQRAMTATYRRDARNLRYLIIRRQPLRGNLHPDALAVALGHLIEVHPALRTSIAEPVGGTLIQRIHARAATPLTIHDLTALGAGAQERVIADLVDQRRRSGLPLEHAPLFALDLFKLAERNHELVWTIHHAVLDGWSLARLVEQTSRLHGLLADGKPLPPLSPPGYDMPAVVAREQAFAADERRMAFWRGMLDGVEPSQLPRLAATAATGRTGSVPIVRFSIARNLVLRLAAVARTRGVAVKAVYLAAYLRVIGATCARSPVLTGLCTHQRLVDGMRDAPGLFVTTLPVVADHDVDSWAELIDTAHRLDQAIFAQRHMPLPAICAAMGQEALFEHNFNFADFHGDIAGVAAEPSAADKFLYNLNEFALTLNVVLDPAGDSTAYFSHDSERISADQVGLIGEIFAKALEGIADDTGAAPELVTGALRTRLLHSWNDTAEALPARRRIHDGFLEAARASPDAVAIVDEHGCLSYSELLDAAVSLSVRLEIARRDRVMVMMPRGRGQVVAAVAVLLAGGVFVPVDAAWPPARLQSIRDQVGAAAVICPGDTAYAETIVRPVRLDSAVLTVPSGDGVVPPDQSEPEDLAYIIFTSGSTGMPKGVSMTHAATCTTLIALTRDLHLTASDRVLSVSPFVFDLAIFDIFALLAVGGAIVYPPARPGLDADGWLDLCETHAVTIWNTVPISAALLVEAAEQLPTRRLLIRLFMLSGDRIAPSLPCRLRRLFPDAAVLSLGGATEAAIWSIFYPVVEDTSGWTAIPYGRPLPNQSFYILDAADRLVVPGAIGHLHIGGDGLAQGYYGDSERTAAAFYHHPELGKRLYRTGDLALYRADGVIELVGRSDQMVKLRGHRVDLGELEACFGRHPSVVQAVAGLVAEADSPGRLVVWLRLRDGVALPERAELRAHASAFLPSYMLPHAYVAIAQVPTNANGKVDRGKLPMPPRTEAALEQLSADPLEARFFSIWRDQLGLEARTGNDNLFELGGDSVSALRFLAEARDQGFVVTLRDFYNNPTIAGAARAARIKERVDQEPTGPVPLLPSQAWLFGSPAGDPAHFNQSWMLAVPHAMEAQLLARALASLADRHVAFRLRFSAGPAGWSAFVAGDDFARPVLEQLDARGLDENARRALQLETGERLQRSFDLSNGPLLRAALFEHERDRRVLIIVHHLAIDALSWHSIFDDISRFCSAAGDADRLPPPARGLVERARVIDAMMRAGMFDGEIDMWRAALDGHVALAPARRGPPSRERMAATSASWQQACAAAASSGFSPRDVFVAAAARSLGQWAGRMEVAVTVEQHGRDDLEAVGDAAGVVGWFTAAFPVKIDLTSAPGPMAALAIVRDCLARVPRGGIGYGALRHLAAHPALAELPEPDVILNFFGDRFFGDRGGGETASQNLIEPVGEPTGASADPALSILNALAITAVGGGSGLDLACDWDEGLFNRSDVERILDGLVANIDWFARACRTEADPGSYPATPMQNGILLHSRLDEIGRSYVNQVGLSLRGSVDCDRLRSAWNALVARHDIFRTGFLPGDDGYRQRLSDAVDLPWRFKDLSTLTESDRESRRAAVKREERSCEFDFARPPLMRVCLLKLGAERFEMIWSYHHALLDGWSLSIALTDLAALFEGRIRPEALPAPPPFRRYVEWLTEQDRAGALAYWSRLLGDFEAPVRLSRPGEASATAPREVAHLSLEADADARVRAAASRLHVTVNVMLQVAWAYVLHRHSGADDIVFGAVHAGRPSELAGAEAMVGLFINTLPVRLRFDRADLASDLIGRAFAQQSETLLHAAVPLAEIQDCAALDAAGDLFETILVFENYPLPDGAGHRADGLSIEAIENREATHYPLTLIADARHGFNLRLSYRPELISAALAIRLMADLEATLLSLADRPTLPLAELSLPSVKSSEVKSYCPSLPLDHDDLAAAFDAVAERRPDAIAITFGVKNLCYAEVKQRSDRLSAVLVAAGAPGRRVAVLLSRKPDVVVAILAILKAGASYVPIDLGLPDERRAFILSDSDCRIAVVEPGAAPEGLEHCISPDGTTLSCGPPPGDGVGSDGLDRSAANEAYLIYTSGTTGLPKGVAVSHRNVLRLFAATADEFAFSANDCWALFHSHGFDFSVWELWGALLYGGRLVIVPEVVARDSSAWAALVDHEKITILNQTPTAFYAFAEAAAERKLALASLRIVIFGGEALDCSALGSWIECHGLARPRLVNMYGITETTVHTTIHEIGPADLVRTASCIGRPLRDVSVRVLDPWGREMPVGAIGELYVGGAGVAIGYHDRSALTAERFVTLCGDRCYRSGDLGFRDDAGLLYHVGRGDRQVKIRGYRIELGEIEARITNVEGVRQSVVLKVGEGAAAWLAAYIVAQSVDSSLALVETVRAKLAADLPGYMMPAVIVPLAEMPVTPNGKLDLAALPPTAPAAASAWTPEDPIERELLAIWSEFLAMPVDRPNANFFRLGGNSLKLAQVIEGIRRRFGIVVAFAAFYDQPSIAAQATLLREAAQAPDRQTVPILSDEVRRQGAPLLPAQLRLFYLCQSAEQNAAYSLPLLIEIIGPLDPEALHSSVRATMERHESLRTVFRSVSGEPRQFVKDTPDRLFDLATAGSEAEARDMLTPMQSRPFDLARDLPCRFALVRVAPDVHLLAINLHHMAVDAWSMTILFEDLAASYRAATSGVDLAIAPLDCRPSDVAAWYSAPEQRAAATKDLAFWRRALDGQSGILQLRTDMPRPPVPALAGEAVPIAFEPALSYRLASAASARSVTGFVQVLAAYALLASRLSGDEVVIVGTAFGARPRAEFERVIGFMASTLPIPVRVRGGGTVAAYLEDVHAIARDAMEHGSAALDDIIDALGIWRPGDRMPLFQIVLAYQNVEVAALDLGGLRLRRLPLERRSAKFDLALTLADRDGRLVGELEYDSRLFARGSAERIVAGLRVALDWLSGDPDRSIDEFDPGPLLMRESVSSMVTSPSIVVMPSGDELEAELSEFKAP